MRRSSDPSGFLPLKTDELLILLVLAARPLHGYGIMRDVETRSDGQVVLQTGALYRTLRGLVDLGLIEACARPADADSLDNRRRYYHPTTLGRAVLEAEVGRMSALVRAARLTAGGKRPRLV
ncbi:MAG TPA: helix-turn-helix transcriptional regulator [Vicinamibacterales bacterium]|nr:helix-turn-helix transcriptional regulator [Vicinamibacterales bacterium]